MKASHSAGLPGSPLKCWCSQPPGVTGKIIRTISAVGRDVFPSSGYAVWDGMNDSGRQAATGLYIAYVPMPNGSAKVRVVLIR